MVEQLFSIAVVLVSNERAKVTSAEPGLPQKVPETGPAARSRRSGTSRSR